VNTCAAVDVRRIFVGKKKDFQREKELNAEARMSNDELLTNLEWTNRRMEISIRLRRWSFAHSDRYS
jgi:hypothetical protein